LGSTPIGAPIVGLLGEHLGPRVDFLLAGSLAMGMGAGVLVLARRARSRALSGVAAPAIEHDRPAGVAEAEMPLPASG